MKYKLYDWVVVKSHIQCGEGNGIGTRDYVAMLMPNKEDDNYSGMYYKESDFAVKADDRDNGEFYRIKKEHIIRHATSDEVEKAGGKLTYEIY